MDTWFITANDTGVGKTVLTVLLARLLDQQGIPFRAVKPFCSGGRADARALHRAQRRQVPLDTINPWHFRPALAPAVAASLRGQVITQAQVESFLHASHPETGFLLIEGAGGLLTPLGPDFTARELIRDARATPLVVCSNRLGVINQARLVWEALPPPNRRRARLILMDAPKPDSSTKTNLTALSSHIDPSRIHRLPWLFQGVWGPMDCKLMESLSQLLR
jgi:dethiobiotin synthetase